jgi:LPPG:FO 2-phospho-L-lactate transferase
VHPRPVDRIVLLGGGYAGARFTQGLLHGIGHGLLPGVSPTAQVTVVANTGDDLWIHGLRVCPDLDTVMYTLGDGIDGERGWGRRDETWSVREELAAYGVSGSWFGLGDRDVATHLVRTALLRSGRTLSEATRHLCERWPTGVTLLPMTDDEVETHVTIDDPADGRRTVHFQEYWVRLRAEVPVVDVELVGRQESAPAPGVLAAIQEADVVLLPPSNPIVSVGTVLAVPGIRDALRDTTAPVVGLSPIVGGHHVRGMAAQLLTWAGIEVSAAAVGAHYGARSHGGLLDGWLVDETDAASLPDLDRAHVRAAAVPLMMTDPGATAAMAAEALALAQGRSQTVASSEP